jgi:hypothetical protein
MKACGRQRGVRPFARQFKMLQMLLSFAARGGVGSSAVTSRGVVVAAIGGALGQRQARKPAWSASESVSMGGSVRVRSCGWMPVDIVVAVETSIPESSVVRASCFEQVMPVAGVWLSAISLFFLLLRRGLCLCNVSVSVSSARLCREGREEKKKAPRFFLSRIPFRLVGSWGLVEFVEVVVWCVGLVVVCG